MKTKKVKRHILGVGFPFFKKSSVDQSKYTGVFLLKKDKIESAIADLKVTGRIGMWKKCRLVLEEI